MSITTRERRTARQPREPRWWQLYLGLPLICGLFLIEMRLHISATAHTVLQLTILGLIFGFLQVWLRANRSAMMRMDMDVLECQGGLRVYEVPPARLVTGPSSDPVSQPLAQMPHLEVKGVLGTTFEMERTDELLYSNNRATVAREQ